MAGARQVEAALARVFGEQAAVRSVDARHHRRLVVGELGVVGQVLLVLPDEERRHAAADHEHERAGGEHESRGTARSSRIFGQAFPPRTPKVRGWAAFRDVLDGAVRGSSARPTSVSESGSLWRSLWWPPYQRRGERRSCLLHGPLAWLGAGCGGARQPRPRARNRPRVAPSAARGKEALDRGAMASAAFVAPLRGD